MLKLATDGEATVRLPNFVVLGPPRTATTWLFRSLEGHPQVFVPNMKEARFFDERYAQGLAWYQALYAEAPLNTLAIGDITPGYLIAPQAPERIRQVLGENVRLFIIVRDPVERAYSHYKMLRRSGLVGDNFATALQDTAELVENSLYAKQMERYLAYFPAEQLRLLDYSSLLVTPVEYFQRFLREIGVAANSTQAVQVRVNQAVEASVSPKLVRTTTAVRQVIEQNKIGRALLWRLRDAGVINKWHRLTAQRRESEQPLSEEQHERIYQHFFADDFTQLQRFRQHYIA